MSSDAGPERFFRPILPFDSDSPEFTRGFEIGRLWAKLREHPNEPIEEWLHASNAEMVLRVAEATGRTVMSKETGDNWLKVSFEPAE
jgi:hypothetical protein